ncbi:MAG: sulfurtransferase TusA family protein [Methylophagaceae bacterium]
MSNLSETINLTLYGCPLHYIKAREALSEMAIGQEVLLEVNNGDAIDEVVTSLRNDGQLCDIESEQTLTSIIKVVKKS